MHRFGVYSIVNLSTGTIYIGSTSRSFLDRKQDHWAKLRLGCHQNSRMMSSYRKYGEGAFEFAIVEVVRDPPAVREAEQRHIDLHFGRNCFNARPIAESNRGWSPSEETRAAMSRASKARPPMSDGTKAKLSVATKGLVRNLWSAESREKLAAGKRGVARPPELIGRFREIQNALCSDPAHVARISAHFLNPEFRAANSARHQKSFAGVFTAPDGREFRGVVHLTRFCGEHDLLPGMMSMVTRGLRPHHKGWTYRDAIPLPDRE